MQSIDIFITHAPKKSSTKNTKYYQNYTALCIIVANLAMKMKSKWLAERLGRIESSKSLAVLTKLRKKRLLVKRSSTNLSYSAVLLHITHHPRKTAQAVENHCFPIRQTNCSNVVFISRKAYCTQEKCYWDLEVTRHHWKEQDLTQLPNIGMESFWMSCKAVAASTDPSSWSAWQSISSSRSARGYGTLADTFRNSQDKAYLEVEHYIRRWWKGPKPGSQPIYEILWKNIFNPCLAGA